MPAVIDTVLNHKEAKGVTKIYQRYDYAKEMAEAWAKWGRHLATMVDPVQNSPEGTRSR
ncbi:MAG: hypothetical protein U7M05_02580 [Candidatus Igneacidithiobacillus chanchocoensis]